MRAVETVAIIGGGTMGGGIAITTTLAGLKTILVDRSQDVLTKAKDRLTRYLDRQVAKDRIGAADVLRAKRLLILSTDIAASSRADLVIEAVFENLETKETVLRALEPHVSHDCIIATNTSCLRVSEIAKALKHPERFIGLHYFSPAEVNPIVELVHGNQSSEDAIEPAQDFLEQTGKQIIRCLDRNGFALNRFFCPYSNEAIRCVEDGLGTPAQVDMVARALFGQALGPFATMNIVKPVIMLHCWKTFALLGPIICLQICCVKPCKAGKTGTWKSHLKSIQPLRAI